MPKIDRKILREIEKLRWDLIRMTKAKDFTHPDVLLLSKELDEKLNEYHKREYL